MRRTHSSTRVLPDGTPLRNRLLSALPTAAYNRIAKHLRLESMVPGDTLHEHGRRIDDARLSVLGRRGRAQHEQPARRDHADAEGEMARIHQMDGHRTPPQTEGPVALKTKRVTRTIDIVMLLRGSSVASGSSEAEATSRAVWHHSGWRNVVYRTFPPRSGVCVIVLPLTLF